jgi:hypothetical protein
LEEAKVVRHRQLTGEDMGDIFDAKPENETDGL